MESSDKERDAFGLARLSRRLAFRGEVVDFYKDTVRLPDGKLEEWDYIHHKKGCGAAVVAVLPDRRILLVRQYRPAVDEVCLELPAGSRDDGDEDLSVTAARELREETGYALPDGGKIRFLCRLRSAPAWTNEYTEVYLAENVTRAGDLEEDEAEDLRVEAHPLPELLEAITNGTLTDGKTAAGILAYAVL